MSLFGYMRVFCPICRCEFDGMHPYGSDWKTCGKECHNELEYRRTRAILGKSEQENAGVAIRNPITVSD